MGASNFASLNNASKYFVVLTDREEKVVKCNDCEVQAFEYDDEYQTAEETKCCWNCTSQDISWETETVSPESYEIDDLTENLRSAFNEKFGAECSDSDYCDGDRNYNGSGISKIRKDIFFGGVDIIIYFDVIRNSAYYEGANLDYLITFDLSSVYATYDFDQVDELDIDDLSGSYLNDGMKVIQLPKIIAKIKNVVQVTSAEIETVLAQFSDGYDRAGGFSDGTSLYTKSA